MIVETKKEVQRKDGRCARVASPAAAAAVVATGSALAAPCLACTALRRLPVYRLRPALSKMSNLPLHSTSACCSCTHQHLLLLHSTLSPCRSVIKFDRNSCVLVNAKGLPIGTRVLGFVTHELRARQMMKVGVEGWARWVNGGWVVGSRVGGGCSGECLPVETHVLQALRCARGELAAEHAQFVAGRGFELSSCLPAPLQVLSLAARVF